jgi:nucleoside-diphosphate-sugar epimerase
LFDSDYREMNMVEENPTALVVGATGIAGGALARRLLANGWNVLGLSRSKPEDPLVHHVAADVVDSDAVLTALSGLRPDFVFFTVWSRQATEAENITVNGGIVRDVLKALAPVSSVRHVALVTGLKHYMGPFEAYGTGEVRDTPFHEDEARISVANFYYAQEDEMFASAAEHGFTWSVHRSHTMIGYATGNAMNMALTIGAAAALCKEAGRPLLFPGNHVQWNGLTDMTDVRLLADHMIWASTTPEAANTPYNVTNGDVFRWRWMWPRVMEMLGMEAVEFDGTVRTLSDQMPELESLWSNVAAKHGLKEPELSRLASWWHTDGDLTRPIECLVDMSNSRQRGFLEYVSTVSAFADAYHGYRDAAILP